MNYLIGTEDDDEIMGDDGLMGGTTTVDDLKISGNISATNTSIIGGKLILSRNTGTNYHTLKGMSRCFYIQPLLLKRYTIQ